MGYIFTARILISDIVLAMEIGRLIPIICESDSGELKNGNYFINHH